MSKLLTNLVYKKDGRNIFSKCGALSNQSNVTNVVSTILEHSTMLFLGGA